MRRTLGDNSGCNYRTIRGLMVAAAPCAACPWWLSDGLSANP